MSFELSESRETEDHYVITLSFRPQGTFPGVPGSEQFYVTKEGVVDLRQVLDLPRLAEGRRIPIIPITIGIGVVIVGVIVAVIAGPTIGIPPVVPVVHTLTTSASPAQPREGASLPVVLTPTTREPRSLSPPLRFKGI